MFWKIYTYQGTLFVYEKSHCTGKLFPNHFKFSIMSNDNKILEGHSELEKGAYLGALASIASADRSASSEELEYLSDLSDAADLSARGPS